MFREAQFGRAFQCARAPWLLGIDVLQARWRQEKNKVRTCHSVSQEGFRLQSPSRENVALQRATEVTLSLKIKLARWNGAGPTVGDSLHQTELSNNKQIIIQIIHIWEKKMNHFLCPTSLWHSEEIFSLYFEYCMCTCVHVYLTWNVIAS